MRICIIVRILWPGGPQRIAFAEAEGLKKLGHSVDLIFIRSTGKYVYDSDINYSVLYDDRTNRRLLGRIFRRITLHYLPQRGDDATVDIDLIYKAEHNLRDTYDVIYYFDEFSAFFQKHNKNKYGNKTAVLLHEVALFRGSLLSKFVQKKAIKNADVILTNTKENLEMLLNYGIKNAFEAYPGLLLHNDIPDFNQRENLAISVTMWDYGRKPEVFLDVAKRMKKGKLILAGTWADEEYLKVFQNLVQANELENRLVVTGNIREKNLTDLYKKSKIFIRFGYDEKGPGMGSLEGISWGIPLIINEGIGIKEVVKNNVNGFIVNETDVDYTVRLIDELFSDREKWTEISKNNIALAKELDWDNHCAKLNTIFGNMLK